MSPSILTAVDAARAQSSMHPILQGSAVPRSATVKSSFKLASGATLQLAEQFSRVSTSEKARSEDRATFWSRGAHLKPSPDHKRGEEAESSLDSQPVLHSDPHSGLNATYCDQSVVTGSISAPALPRWWIVGEWLTSRALGLAESMCEAVTTAADRANQNDRHPSGFGGVRWPSTWLDVPFFKRFSVNFM
jgi:hypothetical protein